MTSSCLFCKIVAGEIPAAIVAESEHCLAFRDIGPHAPTHVLIIPRKHVESLNQLDDPAIAAALFAMTREVAEQEGVAASGYRVAINTNADGNQTVFHLHLHLLGGRKMTWPPG
ncbi:MAG: histidine triad nucleotide-binding protein [Gemmatimonadetes bacterium]|nr:histidine triad nucleotide-binding protein [Gemmatimonadota bacterium]